MSNPNEIKQEEVDDWIKSLYKNDNEFQIEYAGKVLKFNKRFSTKLAMQLQSKGQVEQTFHIIAIQSVSPKFNVEQVQLLPQDLITQIMLEFAIDPDLLKKKHLSPRPLSSTVLPKDSGNP